MGNQQPAFSQKLSSKYDFISYHNDPTIGPLKIYRKRQPFYNYLMLVDRWIHHQDIPKHEQQLNTIVERQRAETDSMLFKLYAKDLIEDSLPNHCNSKLHYRLYLEYFNYTLKNLIDHRNHQQAQFTIDELIYVLNCVLQTYHFFRSIDATECSFHSDQMFLTPDGQLRFSPLQIFPKPNAHETDCVDGNCMPVKFKKTFRIQDKLILYEIKKIVTEMTQISYSKTAQDKNLFRFKSTVSSSNSVNQLEQLIWKSALEKLQFNPKKRQISQEGTTKGLSLSNSSKISVKYAKSQK